MALMIFAACADRPKDPLKQPVDRHLMADSVKTEFLHAWNGYKTHAWGYDALKPLSQTAHNWYEHSLLMTPVDAFSTLMLMQLNQEASEAKKLILKKLSFDRNMDVQVFEVNIRLLGGLLSAYELDGDPEFLRLAEDLARRLLPAFRSPTGMPCRTVNLRTGATRDPVSNPAEIGTYILEWGTLSRLTGNERYYDTAKKAMISLYQRRSPLNLLGTQIHVETGQWLNTESHLSGMIDSFYEYLVKGWLMFGDPEFKSMWETLKPGIDRYLVDQHHGLWIGRADMGTGRRTRTWFGSLDCFFPATLALAGETKMARRLQESAYRLWTQYGIEPEMMNYETMETVNASYSLRPENLESAYTLYQMTGNDRYLAMGKVFFDSLVRYCRNETAYAHLRSVHTKEQIDSMESFFLAETLKYAYLLFHPERLVNFEEMMFNTEAHPLRIRH